MQDGNILFHYRFVNFDYAAYVISQLIYSRKQAVSSIHVFTYCISPVIHFICYTQIWKKLVQLVMCVLRVVFNPTMQSSFGIIQQSWTCNMSLLPRQPTY